MCYKNGNILKKLLFILEFSKVCCIFVKIFDMKSLIFKILFFGAAVYLLQGCFNHKTEYSYLDQEVKDYYVFKEDSYWIYQDSLTNSTDSVVLKQVVHDFEKKRNRMGNITFLHETYRQEYCHYLSDTSFILSSFLVSYSGLSFPAIAFNLENHNTHYRILYFCYAAIQYPIEYCIGEHIFYNVINFEHSTTYLLNDSIWLNNKNKSYWAKNVGLIRYEIYSSDTTTILNTYNLIKYNVSQ